MRQLPSWTPTLAWLHFLVRTNRRRLFDAKLATRRDGVLGLLSY